MGRLNRKKWTRWVEWNGTRRRRRRYPTPPPPSPPPPPRKSSNCEWKHPSVALSSKSSQQMVHDPCKYLYKLLLNEFFDLEKVLNHVACIRNFMFAGSLAYSPAIPLHACHMLLLLLRLCTLRHVVYVSCVHLIYLTCFTGRRPKTMISLRRLM